MATETLDITEARNQFNRLGEQVKVKHVINVTRHAKPVFAVVDIEFLTTVLETIEIMSDPDSYRMFMQSLEDIREGRVHDQDDVRRELGL